MHGVDLGLDRVLLALERLGSPERRIPAVHIAGTNGKGSCAAFTDSILRQAGLHTGLFTSPHLSRFTERIRIDGVEIDGDHLARLDEVVAGTNVPLTFFEVSAVLAFLAFAEAKVDVAILETGLGGRLDATSVCHPLACAITSIALDHEAILGSTIAAIAYEKACIAKPGIPLFLGPLVPEADDRVAKVALAKGLMTADKLDAMSAKDKTGLIFLPGLSTNTQVSEVSGRGVGMDVVATRIRGDLKGDVQLRTEPGKGTRVTLVLPLTLTIVNALIVRGDDQLYALPLTDVDSTAKLLLTEIHGEDGRETAQWMDAEVPVFSLDAFFGGGGPFGGQRRKPSGDQVGMEIIGGCCHPTILNTKE